MPPRRGCDALILSERPLGPCPGHCRKNRVGFSHRAVLGNLLFRSRKKRSANRSPSERRTGARTLSQLSALLTQRMRGAAIRPPSKEMAKPGRPGMQSPPTVPVKMRKSPACGGMARSLASIASSSSVDPAGAAAFGGRRSKGICSLFFRGDGIVVMSLGRFISGGFLLIGHGEVRGRAISHAHLARRPR